MSPLYKGGKGTVLPASVLFFLPFVRGDTEGFKCSLFRLTALENRI